MNSTLKPHPRDDSSDMSYKQAIEILETLYGIETLQDEKRKAIALGIKALMFVDKAENIITDNEYSKGGITKMTDREKFKKLFDEVGIKYTESGDTLYIDKFACDGAEDFGISFWDGEDYPKGSFHEFWVVPEGSNEDSI